MEAQVIPRYARMNRLHNAFDFDWFDFIRSQWLLHFVAYLN